jgi:hypothetical protein
MAVRIKETTKATLVAVPVPLYFKGTALSHSFIMDYMESELDKAGITVENALYRSTADGGVAQCVYKLNKNRILAWTNSYIQGMRFKCGSGIYLKGDTYMIGDTEPSLIRSIDVSTRVKQEIDDIILNLDTTVKSTVQNLIKMKTHTVTSTKQAEILGVLYAEYKILTSEQISSVAKNIKKGTNSTLSSAYNELAIVLKKAHPRSWMDHQRELYQYFLQIENSFMLATAQALIDNTISTVDPVVIDPDQVSILDQIQELKQIESEDINETENSENLLGTASVEPNQSIDEIIETVIVEEAHLDIIDTKISIIDNDADLENIGEVIDPVFSFNDDDDDDEISLDL